MNNKTKGAYGENLASDYLAKKGYKIVARNCIFAGAELDIVCILPKNQQKKEIKSRFKKEKFSKTALKNELESLEDTLVFVEVKYSSTKEFGEPYERVTPHKQHQIFKAAELYILKNNLGEMPVRFDVISIVGDQIEHIENAF